MFKFVAVLALLACAFAQHHGHGHGHEKSHGNNDDAHAEIKHIHSDVHEYGFHYGFETSNKIKTFSEGDGHGNHRGNFEWVSPEGQHIKVQYVADENGYQPQSDVLPTPPPIPVGILKGLKYIEERPHDKVPSHGSRRFK